MLLLRRVRTFAESSLKRVLHQPFNTFSRSRRVETFNRALPESREGGPRIEAETPPSSSSTSTSSSPYFHSWKNNRNSSSRKSVSANFFPRPLISRISFQKKRVKWKKGELFVLLLRTECSPRKNQEKEEEEELWIESGSIKIFPRQGGVRCVFFFFFLKERDYRCTEDKREREKGRFDRSIWKKGRKFFERKSWKDSENVG